MCKKPFLSGGVEQDERAVQLMEWHWKSVDETSTYRVEFSFLFREDGKVSSHHETHIHGLFSFSEYIEVLEKVGFRILATDSEGRYFLAEK